MTKNDELTARNIPIIDPTRAAQTRTNSSLAIQPNWDNTHLINFLQVELAIPAASISLALRRQKQDPAPLPMILWQYGLISTEQLDQSFNWLEHSSKSDLASRGSLTTARNSLRHAAGSSAPNATSTTWVLRTTTCSLLSTSD